MECLKSAMTKAIGAYKSVILGEPVDATGQDKNMIYYGSRAGMQVTVLSRKGPITPNAVISVEHRREDAAATTFRTSPTSVLPMSWRLS